MRGGNKTFPFKLAPIKEPGNKAKLQSANDIVKEPKMLFKDYVMHVNKH